MIEAGADIEQVPAAAAGLRGEIRHLAVAVIDDHAFKNDEIVVGGSLGKTGDRGACQFQLANGHRLVRRAIIAGPVHIFGQRVGRVVCSRHLALRITRIIIGRDTLDGEGDVGAATGDASSGIVDSLKTQRQGLADGRQIFARLFQRTSETQYMNLRIGGGACAGADHIEQTGPVDGVARPVIGRGGAEHGNCVGLAAVIGLVLVGDGQMTDGHRLPCRQIERDKQPVGIVTAPIGNAVIQRDGSRGLILRRQVQLIGAECLVRRAVHRGAERLHRTSLHHDDEAVLRVFEIGCGKVAETDLAGRGVDGEEAALRRARDHLGEFDQGCHTVKRRHRRIGLDSLNGIDKRLEQVAVSAIDDVAFCGFQRSEKRLLISCQSAMRTKGPDGGQLRGEAGVRPHLGQVGEAVGHIIAVGVLRLRDNTRRQLVFRHIDLDLVLGKDGRVVIQVLRVEDEAHLLGDHLLIGQAGIIGILTTDAVHRDVTGVVVKCRDHVIDTFQIADLVTADDLGCPWTVLPVLRDIDRQVMIAPVAGLDPPDFSRHVADGGGVGNEIRDPVNGAGRISILGTCRQRLYGSGKRVGPFAMCAKIADSIDQIVDQVLRRLGKVGIGLQCLQGRHLRFERGAGCAFCGALFRQPRHILVGEDQNRAIGECQARHRLKINPAGIRQAFRLPFDPWQIDGAGRDAEMHCGKRRLAGIQLVQRGIHTRIIQLLGNGLQLIRGRDRHRIWLRAVWLRHRVLYLGLLNRGRVRRRNNGDRKIAVGVARPDPKRGIRRIGVLVMQEGHLVHIHDGADIGVRLETVRQEGHYIGNGGINREGDRDGICFRIDIDIDICAGLSVDRHNKADPVGPGRIDTGAFRHKPVGITAALRGIAEGVCVHITFRVGSLAIGLNIGKAAELIAVDPLDRGFLDQQDGLGLAAFLRLVIGAVHGGVGYLLLLASGLCADRHLVIIVRRVTCLSRRGLAVFMRPRQLRVGCHRRAGIMRLLHRILGIAADVIFITDQPLQVGTCAAFLAKMRGEHTITADRADEILFSLKRVERIRQNGGYRPLTRNNPAILVTLVGHIDAPREQFARLEHAVTVGIQIEIERGTLKIQWRFGIRPRERAAGNLDHLLDLIDLQPADQPFQIGVGRRLVIFGTIPR